MSWLQAFNLSIASYFCPMSMTLLIILATAGLSIPAFKNAELRSKAIFYPYLIRRNGEYYRFLTSGFLHNDWMHLLVNMFVLYSFGPYLEDLYVYFYGTTGRVFYLLFYISAIAVANLSTYFKHKNNEYYRSLGASGAVSAVVFAFIFFNPQAKLMLIFLPIPVNAVLMGLLYIAYSYYMGRRGSDHINHDAHLLGAVYGFGLNALLHPELLPSFLNQLEKIIGL